MIDVIMYCSIFDVSKHKISNINGFFLVKNKKFTSLHWTVICMCITHLNMLKEKMYDFPPQISSVYKVSQCNKFDKDQWYLLHYTQRCQV